MIDWTATAAWVQALGSIGAILAAIWIGERSSKRSRELVESERRRQADIIAATLEMRLRVVEISLDVSRNVASDLLNFVNSGQQSVMPEDQLRLMFLLHRPEEVTALKSHAMIFDKDVGIAIIKTLDEVGEYNPRIESSISQYVTYSNRPLDLASLCRRVMEEAEQAKDECSRLMITLMKRGGRYFELPPPVERAS